jgi:hypothetical protein
MGWQPGRIWCRGTVHAVCERVRLCLASLPVFLESPRAWVLACRYPWMFAGEYLHLAGLHAFSAREYETAVLLFEGAARRYREALKPEPLARARVHQLMAGACAAGGWISPLSLEVDRALTRLDWIESPEPPFALVPAHVLLASWLEGADAAADDEVRRAA